MNSLKLLKEILELRKEVKNKFNKKEITKEKKDLSYFIFSSNFFDLGQFDDAIETFNDISSDYFEGGMIKDIKLSAKARYERLRVGPHFADLVDPDKMDEFIICVYNMIDGLKITKNEKLKIIEDNFKIAENEFIEELKKGMVLVSEIKNNPTIH